MTIDELAADPTFDPTDYAGPGHKPPVYVACGVAGCKARHVPGSNTATGRVAVCGYCRGLVKTARAALRAVPDHLIKT